jgi:hypothetical protein
MELVTLLTPKHTSCQLGSLTEWVSSPSYNVLGVTVNIVLIAHLRGDFHMTPDTRTNFLNVIARR